MGITLASLGTNLGNFISVFSLFMVEGIPLPFVDISLLS